MPNPWDNDPIVAPARQASPYFIPPSPARVAEKAAEAARQAAAESRARDDQGMEARRFQWEQEKHAQEMAAQNGTAIPGDDHLTGADYLKSLPSDVAAQVRALAEGRQAFPTGKAASSPYWQQRMAAVAQFDPEFDTINYNARNATRKDFTSGKSSANIKALNTAIGHLGQLGDQIGGTYSYGGFPGAQTVNHIGNALARSSGSSGITKFEQTAGALAGELTQVYRQSGGAEADIQRYLTELDSGQSLEQKKAAVANMAGLLKSRLDAINDQYVKGMGTTAQPLQVLDPHAVDTLKKYLPGFNPGNYSGGAGGGSGGGQGAGGPGGSPLTQGGGPGYQTATGEAYSTPEDMQVSNAVYGAMGGGLAAMVKAARDNGYEPAPNEVAGWRKSLDDAKRTGGKPGLNPLMRGQRGAAAQQFGKVAASPVGAFGIGAANTMSMGGLDEITGAVNSAFTGRSAADEITYADFGKRAAAEANPGSYLGGQLAGGAAQGFGAAKLAPGLFGSMGASVPRIAGAGGLYGGAQGALEDNADRTGGAAGGAVVGALGGVVGSKVIAPLAEAAMRSKGGQLLSEGVRGAVNRIRPGTLAPDGGVPAFTPGERALPRFDPAELNGPISNLRDADRLHLPYALADADPKLRMLAGSVARKSPDARALAEDTFDPRSMGQADRAVNAIDTHLAPVTNVEQRGSDLLAAGDQAAAPYYNMAMERAGPVDPTVAALLKTPAGQASLTNARTIAANKGLDPNKMGFDLNDQGEVILKSVPSFETLQLVKRGMDQHLNSFQDQFGNLNLRGNPLAQSVADLKGRFNARLGELNPNYAEGNRVWSGYAQRKDALDLGHKVMPNNNIPYRQFEASRAGLTPETLPEAQMGFATSMADQANKARLNANPYDAIYGSPNQQQKVAGMFPEGAPNFDRTYGLEKDMAKTRQETLGGSPTASRQAADQMFEGPGMMALDAAAQVGTGGGFSPIGAIKMGARMMGDNAKLGFGRKKADALAPILFNDNPRAVLDYLDSLGQRQIQDATRKGAFKRRSGLFGATVAPALLGSE
jgi:hypothetical protein